MKDEHEIFTNCFVKNFKKCTGRSNLTDAEMGDFIRISEIYAKFATKYDRKFKYAAGIKHPLRFIHFAFEMKNQDKNMKSWWFKSESFWNNEFKAELQDRGYMDNF